MNYQIEVENIKCGGCSRSIEDKIGAIPGIDQVSIDIDNGRVSVSGADSLRDQLCEALESLGYPERGTAAGLSAFGAKAKSVVSCAVGRMRS